MMKGFFISSSLAGKCHFISINDEKKIEGINQGTFSDIIWPHQLKTITVVQPDFGFPVYFRIEDA
jgi:hypothetical protein